MITIYETIANEAAHPLALKVTLLCLMTAPFVNSFLFGFRNKSVQMIFLNYMRKELYKNEVQQVCLLNTVWKLQKFFRESTEFYCIYKNSVKSTFPQIFVTLLIIRNIFQEVRVNFWFFHTVFEWWWSCRRCWKPCQSRKFDICKFNFTRFSSCVSGLLQSTSADKLLLILYSDSSINIT